MAIISSGLGVNDVYYKRSLDIIQRERDGSTLRRWAVVRAWPVKFIAGALATMALVPTVGQQMTSSISVVDLLVATEIRRQLPLLC